VLYNATPVNHFDNIGNIFAYETRGLYLMDIVAQTGMEVGLLVSLILAVIIIVIMNTDGNWI
jgi:hypothetical protein